MSWLKRRKVSPLPLPCTPMMLAASLLDKVQQGEVENLVMLVKLKSGVFEISYSTMETSDALMHEKMMSSKANEFFEQ